VGLLLLTARCVIAAVFLRAGLAKLTDLRDFRSAVRNYRLLPPALVPAVAVSLPFAEVAAAIMLAAGILPGVVAGLLALLLLIFAAAIAVNLARGRVFDCGCAGAAPQTISWMHVLSNGALAALAVAVALAPPTALALWPGIPGPFSVATPRGDALPVVLTVVLGLVMLTVLRRAARVSRLSRTFHRPAGPAPALTDSRR